MRVSQLKDAYTFLMRDELIIPHQDLGMLKFPIYLHPFLRRFLISSRHATTLHRPLVVSVSVVWRHLKEALLLSKSTNQRTWQALGLAVPYRICGSLTLVMKEAEQ